MPCLELGRKERETKEKNVGRCEVCVEERVVWKGEKENEKVWKELGMKGRKGKGLSGGERALDWVWKEGKRRKR